MSIAPFTTELPRVSHAAKPMRYLDLLIDRCPEQHLQLLSQVIADLPTDRLMLKLGWRIDLDEHQVQEARLVLTGERMLEKGVDLTQLVGEVRMESQPAARTHSHDIAIHTRLGHSRRQPT